MRPCKLQSPALEFEITTFRLGASQFLILRLLITVDVGEDRSGSLSVFLAGPTSYGKEGGEVIWRMDHSGSIEDGYLLVT